MKSQACYAMTSMSFLGAVVLVSSASTPESYGTSRQSRGTTYGIKTPTGGRVSLQVMDEFIKGQMEALKIPGLSIAIVNGTEVVYYRTLGVANADTKQKVSPSTLFDAGSMTKTPFAFLVMKLVDQGVLNLDAPLHTYLPNPDIPDERYKTITARMVLAHTSGLPNWRFLNPDGKLDIKFTPGTRFLYSGEGYEYLAAVVAHLLKKEKNDLEGVFNQRIARPLGMKNAHFVWDTHVAANQASGHVDGKVASGWGISSAKPGFYASYSMQSEAMEFSKLLIGMIHERGMRKERFRDMYTPQFPQATPGEETRGLGIVIKSTSFGEEFLHTGYNLNFSSAFLFNRKQKFGYVFFTNCEKGMEFNKRLEAFLHR